MEPSAAGHAEGAEAPVAGADGEADGVVVRARRAERRVADLDAAEAVALGLEVLEDHAVVGGAGDVVGAEGLGLHGAGREIEIGDQPERHLLRRPQHLG